MTKLHSYILIFALLIIFVRGSHGNNMTFYLGTELIAPAYTPYNENGDLNLALIPKMVDKYYRDNIKAIIVNTYAGEGPSMDLCTREESVKAWVRAAFRRNIKVMVDVGAIAFVDMLKFVKFCAEIEVTAIFVFPELCYKARTVDEVIRDLKIVSKVAPRLPLIFHDWKYLTRPIVNSIDVYKALLEVPTFAGMATDMDTAIELKRVVGPIKDKYIIIVSLNDANAPFALKIGIFLSIWINVYPKLIWRIVAAAKAGDCEKAADLQTELNDLIKCSTVFENDDYNDNYASRTFVENQKLVYKFMTGWDLRQRLPLVESDASEPSRIRSCLVNRGVLSRYEYNNINSASDLVYT